MMYYSFNNGAFSSLSKSAQRVVLIECYQSMKLGKMVAPPLT